MKKLVIAATALLLSLGVNAQEKPGGAGATAGTIGGVATSSIVAVGVAAGVLAAVVSNSSGTSLPDDVVNPPLCDDGTSPVNGSCTGTTTTITGTGTNTSTTTVTFTYPVGN